MVPLKRRKVVSSGTGNTGDSGNTGSTGSGDKVPIKFPQSVLFLLERKMGASRRAFLSQLGRKKGFQVEELFIESVTHVISENNSGDEVRTWLDSQVGGRAPAHLLDISWYTESMRAGHPVEILHRHKLQEQQVNEAEAVVFNIPSYACQRRTALDNHNTVLTDALSLLAENAELSDEDGRGVAFRRAAAVLKALPEPVTGMTQLRGLPCLGGHSLRVIKDILEDGASGEVELTKESERFKALKEQTEGSPDNYESRVLKSLFGKISATLNDDVNKKEEHHLVAPDRISVVVLTGIFGVGVKTAERWIREQIHSLQQLQDSGQTLNRAQQAGLEHYDDLNQPVTKAEADAIGEIVREAVMSVLPGAQITVIGGFRRGKLTGHDVDFLVTHPEEGREVGLMPKVVSWLESQGFLLYQKTTRNSYLESKDGPARPASNMDRFERCFSIFKLPEEETRGTKQTETLTENTPEDTCSLAANWQVKGGEQMKPAGHKAWRAVRVDLVVSPISQFAFALLGWTGSKLFERELRRWAGHEKAMSLSSHALYDNKQSRYLRATSEEEIFAHLGLDYIPPSERNA